jgi:sugar phosphate isomerase/epimerase
MVGLSLASAAFASGPYAGAPIPLDRVIARAGEAEYDGIELSGHAAHAPLEHYPSANSRRALTRVLTDHGLAVSAYAADFSAASPVVEKNRGPYLDIFRRALDFCHDLNCPAIRVDSVAASASVGEWEYLGVFDRIAGVWAEAAEIASRAKIRVVWEFESGFLFNKPGEVVALHRKVGHPNFQVLFDTCQAYTCGTGGRQALTGGVPEFLKKLEGRVGGVHLMDSTGTRRPFGEGFIDFNILAPQLLDIPNIHWWCVDLCLCPDAWNLIEPSRDFVLDLLNTKVAA